MPFLFWLLGVLGAALPGIGFYPHNSGFCPLRGGPRRILLGHRKEDSPKLWKGPRFGRGVASVSSRTAVRSLWLVPPVGRAHQTPGCIAHTLGNDSPGPCPSLWPPTPAVHAQGWGPTRLVSPLRGVVTSVRVGRGSAPGDHHLLILH